ncbi:helix-turn-helix transcriptional regulator [Albimonas sp. CAU 1670]|uniref:helix-turn-helix domain-containing protein n=1 Tax=Albimonas sp. CAU 1670 TaxID=3032599 RepID=UPI0023D9E297|nr:helix-turn-helix transcriptional regulator [Albimonas sp. CAU 1670]MDF2233145.1 helix-turn-helix transcriptional regulator [Albimonas sp. CAU 1670]
MTINPETLKSLRTKQGLSQQALADKASGIRGASISKRTISRIENGETPPHKVRAHTVDSLAKALDVSPEALGKPPSEISDEEWRDLGFTLIKIRLPDQVRHNYRWALHHYEVSFNDLVEAAPWMFTLLAEMSLARRRRELVEANAAFEEAMAKLPRHLRHGAVAQMDFDDAYYGEDVSISARDVFGAKVLEEAQFAEPFDPSETNPFVDFLRDAATSVGGGAISPEEIEMSYRGGLPNWPIFQQWLQDLTGGDSWARFAVENVKVALNTMPEELRGQENTTARIEWLVDKIPAEIREEEEKRRAEREISLEGIEL